MTDPLGRIPPNDLEAEQALLGCLLLEDDALSLASDQLSPNDFYEANHALIFAAIISLYSDGDPVDALTVRNKLNETGDLDRIGGPECLVGLTEVVPSAASVAYYAGIIRDLSVKRQGITITHGLTHEMFENTQTSGMDMTSEAIHSLSKLTVDYGKGSMRSAAVIMPEMLKLMDRSGTNEKDRIYTHYHDVDKYVRGLRPSKMNVLAGRPSMGKTTFALNIARNAVKHGHPVLVFSLEMPRTEVAQSLAVAESGISILSLEGANATDESWDEFVATTGRACDWPLYIDDKDIMTFNHIAAASERAVKDLGVQLVIIDYLQLVDCPNDRPREQQVANLSRRIKGLGRKLDIPTLVLSQLNRKADERADHRPIPSDLRESGSLEQDADVIMFVWRPDQYAECTPDKQGLAEIVVAKNRSGPVGIATLNFRGPLFRFESIGGVR